MMADLYYKIDLFSDWHTGSGLASGSDVDLLVIKDKYHFPFIPGKTLKGLLKDAAKDLFDAGVLEKKVIKEIFGEEANDYKHSVMGNTYFSNGELTRNLKKQLQGKTGLLYRKISSTAIEKNGQAEKHSLRRIEVTVPIILFAKIENIPNGVHIKALIKCMKMIKRLGAWRNRGFGRCTFSIVQEVNNEKTDI